MRNRLHPCVLLVLPLALAAQAGQNPNLPSRGTYSEVQTSFAQTVGKDHVILVAKETTFLDSAGVVFNPQANPDAPPSALSGSSMRAKDPAIIQEANKGTQLYRFNVDPKEIIEFSVTCPDGDYITQKYTLMQGPDFVPATVSKAQAERTQRIAPRVRAKKLSFNNMESRSVPLLLVVYGETGHKFRIDIKRTLP